MTYECLCGKSVSTRYCPSCGRLSNDLMAALLAHVDKTASKHERLVATCDHTTGTWVEKQQRTATKWRAWHGELVRLLDMKESGE